MDKLMQEKEKFVTHLLQYYLLPALRGLSDGSSPINMLNPEDQHEGEEIADIDLTDKRQMKALSDRLQLLDKYLFCVNNNMFLAPKSDDSATYLASVEICELTSLAELERRQRMLEKSFEH